MNGAHAHLLLNHIPIIGITMGFLLLLFAIFRKSDELKRVSLMVFVVTALFTIPVYLSGEPAEEIIEHLPGFSERLVEQHESAGLIALVMAELTGIVALAGLLISRRTNAVSRPLVLAALLLALGASGVMAWTAYLGGQIRHTEVRPASTSITPQEQNRRGEESERKEGHKED